ncbi:glutamate--tRNA ligase [Patescibacteria group bacterium]|nr:glutamate--tRNA ligase [Patescibacteria group bacterium]
MIRTRFAPSPTGFMHVGNSYSALLGYAYAKANKGRFFIRIEDTDQKRFVKGAEEAIYEGLAQLGIIPDESPKHGGEFGPYRQSERLEIYQKHAQRLVDQGDAYYCFCSSERLQKVREEKQKAGQPPMYDRKCRDLDPVEAKKRAAKEDHVVRLKVPDGEKLLCQDLIRGEIEFDLDTVDDQVLLKSDGYPTYHLAVVVDDHLMKTSHVVRGEEWLPSLPKHILLYRFFGWEAPVWFHNPTLRNPNGKKLSKRDGHSSLSWYWENGFLPQAVLNFLFLLGWSHPDQKEIFGIKEFIKYFRLEDVSPAGPIFDLTKLEWMNGMYLRQAEDKKLVELLKSFASQPMSEELILKTVPLVKERMKRLTDYSPLVDFLVKRIEPKVEELVQKKKTSQETVELLTKISEVLEGQAWEAEKMEESMRGLVAETGWKPRDFFMTLRVAITGKKITPPLFESMELLGKEESLARLQAAVKLLS